jgi:hypothetical protein
MPNRRNAETKLASIRTAMAAGDWEEALRLAAKFQRLGEHGVAIRTARDALNNRRFYEQLGKNVDELFEAGVAALKARYDKSWEKVRQKGEGGEQGNA